MFRAKDWSLDNTFFIIKMHRFQNKVNQEFNKTSLPLNFLDIASLTKISSVTVIDHGERFGRNF